MTSHVNSVVKHSVGTQLYFPPSEPSAATFAVLSSPFLYLANTVAQADLSGLWKFERATGLLGRTRAVSAL